MECNMKPEDQVARYDQWLYLTGLKSSKATYNKVLPFLPKYSYPHGLDHVKVMYYPPTKLYVLLSEAYDGGGTAEKTLKELSGGVSYDYLTWDDGTGIWFPGKCTPLLVARDGSKGFLRGLRDAMSFTKE